MYDCIIQEKDLIDSRIDMLISAKSERSELQFHSPLYIASQQDNLQLVKQLIDNGANPLDKDANGDTLLHFSALLGRLDILKYLVEDVGCNPATEGYRSGTTLHAAASTDHLHIVKYLIEQCQLDPAALSSKNLTPLVHACYNGSIIDVVCYLIRSMLEHMKMEDIMQHSYIATGDNTVHSPLCAASIMGHLHIVKYLIEDCNCDPSLSQDGNKLITPLLSAVSGSQLHVVKYLTVTKQIKPSSVEAEKYLIIASIPTKNLEMVKFITLTFHCNLNSEYNNISPLSLAAGLGNLSIVEFLISLKM